jgi:ABC-type transport system involved in multi-copper enzyme maturation permease subunit
MPVFLRWILAQGPLNPIAVRLVQNGSRRPRHLYIRSIYLGVLILVLLWWLITSATGGQSFSALAKSGAASFTLVAYLQIGLICILAPVFMAGAIAQEASPRTWEVLLTTPLTSTQIVIGNLLGRLFFILALLFASLPLFALTQFFGGVPGSAIFASYLVSGSAAVLVGAIAIALAVSRMAGSRSVFAFYVAVVSYLAITAGIDSYLRSAGFGASGGRGVTLMTAVNPFLALHALLNPTNYPRADVGSLAGLRGFLLETPVTAWCVLSLSLSLMLVVVSTFSVRAGGLGALTSEGGGIPWYRRLLGLGAVGADHRPPRPVSHNPIAWRESTARNATLARIISRWSFIAAGLIFGGILVYLLHTKSLNTRTFREALSATVWGEIAVITLVAINMSSTAVSREREDGTLDLLLTTTITPSSYLYGKLRGLIAYLLPMLMVPIGTLAFASAYTLATDATVSPATPGGGPTQPLVLPEAPILAALVTIPFTAWCVMVGLQWSLKSKGTLASVAGTVGVVGVIAGIVGLCGLKSAEGISGLGPALGAISPATLLFAVINPASAMAETVSGGSGMEAARVSLAVGSVVAAGIYTAVVLGIHAGMVRTFDTTVRRLAGVR